MDKKQDLSLVLSELDRIDKQLKELRAETENMYRVLINKFNMIKQRKQRITISFE